jgi:2',3'-cyclic-nucleotide 2'-phosphodiesterase (5'-nucleotidase family)
MTDPRVNLPVLPSAAMRTALALLVALLLASCATAPSRTPVRFKILQLNDVYKIEGLEGGQAGGLARVRTLRKQLESDGTMVLVLHAGDALYPSVMSKYLDAEPMVDVLNMLDGDANAADPRLLVTFGNHEFDKGDPSVLLKRLEQSQFQWVATNTKWCDPACDKDFPKTTSVAVVPVGSAKIGILGLLYPLKKSYVQSFDPVAAAREAVRMLASQGAEVIVAITHQDMGDDANLVRQVPGIDLVIGGHDHLFMQQQVEGKWITKADADAKSVIVYDITVPPMNAPLATAPLRVTLDQTTPKDPSIDAAVGRWMTALSAKLGGNETLGTAENLLEGVEPAVRGRETALGNLLADAAREQMQTDIAIINGGSIRLNDNIPPGPITRYDMEGIFYYTNALVAFRATGPQVLDLLRNGVSRVDAGDGRFLQVSGLRFTYRGTTVEAADVQIGGKPLDLSATYTVATLDYIFQHGIDDGFTLFSDANRPPKVNVEREADFRGIVEQYIRSRGRVDADVEGRILRIEN